MIIKLLVSLILAINVANAAQTCKNYIRNDWQDSRYINNDDGTVTDINTQLMWKQCAEGLSGNDCTTGSSTSMDWQDALKLNGSNFAGYKDWRLPNIVQLKSLVAYNCSLPSINKNLFPNTPVAIFSSSSPVGFGSELVWLLNFGDGDDYDMFRNYSSSVRLVRPSKK